MLKLLHTADLHLGLESAQFDADARRRLARARLEVARTILSVAEQYAVDAVLWAGDIFDTPEPSEDWWRGFAEVLSARRNWTRPVVLLPGNHDPVKPNSVYHSDHPFRALLPGWVHVVDSDRFELPLGDDAVLLAAPCRSMAGAEDLALSLPGRAEGDGRIRVGLVHGSTFDMEGYQTSFPIARDAPQQRGLDYLAVGDTHAFRVINNRSEASAIDRRVAGRVLPTKEQITAWRELERELSTHSNNAAAAPPSPLVPVALAALVAFAGVAAGVRFGFPPP